MRAYVKNHNLGLEVPYRFGSHTRSYRPDFIVLVDDGRGDDDLLHLVVEIKGRRERRRQGEEGDDGNLLDSRGQQPQRQYGRWAFAEFTDVFEMEQEFDTLIQQQLASSG